MGKVIVQEFVAAGAFVAFDDLHPWGADFEELNSNGENIAFVKFDIRSWDDHIKLSETSKNKSPSKSVAVIIANAALVEVQETAFTWFYLVLLRRLLWVWEMYFLLENLKFISPSPNLEKSNSGHSIITSVKFTTVVTI